MHPLLHSILIKARVPSQACRFCFSFCCSCVGVAIPVQHHSIWLYLLLFWLSVSETGTPLRYTTLISPQTLTNPLKFYCRVISPGENEISGLRIAPKPSLCLRNGVDAFATSPAALRFNLGVYRTRAGLLSLVFLMALAFETRATAFSPLNSSCGKIKQMGSGKPSKTCRESLTLKWNGLLISSRGWDILYYVFGGYGVDSN